MSRLVTAGRGGAGGTTYRGCPESTVRPGKVPGPVQRPGALVQGPGTHGVCTCWPPGPLVFAEELCPGVFLPFSELGQFPLDLVSLCPPGARDQSPRMVFLL